MRELGLGEVEMGYAFGAFFLAYGLFEIPGGWLGDRIGPRKVLTRVVVMWSFFTAATGWVWNLFSLLFTRFWFGAGEAGCFPNLRKVFTTWLPADERTRAQGIMWMSAGWGGNLQSRFSATVPRKWGKSVSLKKKTLSSGCFSGALRIVAIRERRDGYRWVLQRALETDEEGWWFELLSFNVVPVFRRIDRRLR